MWTGIEILYWFQDVRASCPFLEDFFVAVSSRPVYLAVPIMIALCFYWCVDKRSGEKILLGCISAMVAAMNVKYGIGQPRPWKMDPDILFVESANVNGPSLPSGHTAMTASAFGSAAILGRNRLFAAIMIALTILVIMARLFLCVHTPLDILVGLVFALVFTYLSWKAVDYSYRGDREYHLVSLAYILFFTALLVIVLTLWNVDLQTALEYPGFIFGAIVGRELEHRFVGFTVPDVGLRSKIVICTAGGLSGFLVLMIPIILIPEAGIFVGGILMMVWTICVYPMVLKKRLEAVSYDLHE